MKLPRPTYQVASALVLLISALSDILVEYFHKPADVLQAFSPGEDQEECKSASAKDIVERWHKLYAVLDISQRYIKGEFLETHKLSI